ncbi:MAG: hypothetical protein ABII79_07950 [bacterium]
MKPTGPHDPADTIAGTRLKDWLKFAAGLVTLLALAAFFASGYTPPGVLGEVLRHNQVCDIDASPLFYSEVENMSELEDGVRQMRQQAKMRQTPHDTGPAEK